ncbi:MAG TPA: hypothetical protein VIU12_34490 [Chryseolinea sp.]
MITKLRSILQIKFSFGKDSEFFQVFAEDVGAICMYDMTQRLSIPVAFTMENKLRAVFLFISKADGFFLFNISGVDIKKAIKGFSSFEDASANNMITEWELSIILHDKDYYSRTIFHNGVNEFVITNKGIKIKWN